MGISVQPPGPAEIGQPTEGALKGTFNSSTAPGANVALANFTGGNVLAPGYYKIYAAFYFAPTTAPVDGTDNDNIVFEVDGNAIGGNMLAPAIENSVNTYVFDKIYTATGAIKLQTVRAATAAVVYRTSLVAIAL
jgi:hypothetical protein